MSMHIPTKLGALALIFALALTPSFAFAAKKEKGYPVTATEKQLKDAYANGKLRVLVMPGHEPGYGGAIFMGVYEREIVVDIANELAKELKADPNIEVIVARDNLAWHPDIARYFDRNMGKVEKFVKAQKKAHEKKIKKKAFTKNEDDHVPHATAQTDVALRLYGLNKWANENKIDLILNLHINDAPDHGPTTPGANSGFAIYIPDAQYGNGKASRPVAQAIANRLNTFSATSTLRVENKGVVEDQTLIAVGANNTLKVPTALIEYGYITESKFLAPQLRMPLVRDYAYQTYLGLMDFLGKRNNVPATKSLPYTWRADIVQGTTSADVYALQVALRTLGLYPPAEGDLVACPISGTMNECTAVALKAYQKKERLPETGLLDPATRTSLNARFGR